LEVKEPENIKDGYVQKIRIRINQIDVISLKEIEIKENIQTKEDNYFYIKK